MAHTRELLLMVGESGSGKSTIAHQLVQEKGYVRVNQDDLRIELAKDPEGSKLKGRAFEEMVKRVQMSRVSTALAKNLNVVVDNTNINPNTVEKWRKFANHKAAFRLYRVLTDLGTCISRDASRQGKACVGRPVIERQFLESGRLPLDKEKPIVIVDVDGTVADHTGVRSPFDETKVHLDKPHLDVIKMVNELYETHTILVVSGRHSTCGDATVTWLHNNGLRFHHIFMRHGWDNRSDVVVKQEILDHLLTYVDKSKIKLVVDDRKRVIDMWQSNGLTVQMVKDGKNCNYEDLIDF